MDHQVSIGPTKTSRWLAGALALAVAALAAWAFWKQAHTQPAAGAAMSVPASAGQEISAARLEQEHGLRVQLLAVTAAGGLVDVRLKVLDAAKAGPLLNAEGGFPELQAPGGRMLELPKEARPPTEKLQDGQTLLLLYPNTGGSIRPGAPAALRFGNLQMTTTAK